MSYPRQFLIAAAFFFRQENFFSCSTFFKFIFNELCHMIGEIKKGLMVDNK